MDPSMIASFCVDHDEQHRMVVEAITREIESNEKKIKSFDCQTYFC